MADAVIVMARALRHVANRKEASREEAGMRLRNEGDKMAKPPPASMGDKRRRIRLKLLR